MSVKQIPGQSLLLLSPAPSPPTYANVKAAYHAAIFTALKDTERLSQQTRTGKQVLDIALPCPHLYGQTTVSRAALYAPTQKVLANVYKVVTVIAATQSIDVESTEGLDVRVILVAFPRDDQAAQPSYGSAGDDVTGPVISIQTLASSRRPWSVIYSVQTEQGEQVLKTFLSVSEPHSNIQRLRGGITSVATGSGERESADQLQDRKHYSIAVGGTFDHLHIGHKLLLTMFAFMADSAESEGLDLQARTLTVGITAGELLKNKKYADQLESWETRQSSVWDFFAATLNFVREGSDAVKSKVINEEGPNGHAVHYHLPSGLTVKLVEIWDPFGPTITDESMSALVLSAETRSGGKAVNDKRKEKGWHELDLFEVDVLDAEEGDGAEPKDVAQGFQNKLSSTEIRRVQSERSKRDSNI